MPKHATEKCWHEQSYKCFCSFSEGEASPAMTRIAEMLQEEMLVCREMISENLIEMK